MCGSAVIGVLFWVLGSLAGSFYQRRSQRWAVACHHLRVEVAHIQHQLTKKAVSQVIVVRGKRYELQYRRYKRIEQQLHAVVESLPESMRLRSVRLVKTGVEVKGEVKDAAVLDAWLKELRHRFRQRWHVSQVISKGGSNSAFTASLAVAPSSVVGQP